MTEVYFLLMFSVQAPAGRRLWGCGQLEVHFHSSFHHRHSQGRLTTWPTGHWVPTLLPKVTPVASTHILLASVCHTPHPTSKRYGDMLSSPVPEGGEN